MKVQRLASAAIIVLAAGAALGPASAVAHAKPRHRRHHAAGQSHKARTTTFAAVVVRSSATELVVRTTAGKLLTFSSHQLTHPGKTKPVLAHKASTRGAELQVSSGNVVVDLLGLQPGVKIVITETTSASGAVTITITLPPAPPASTPPAELTATGVVTDVENDSFTVQQSDGSDLVLHMDDDTLSNLNLQSCDTVSVTYHQDAGILIADDVTDTGTSTTGDCAPSFDADGTITPSTDGNLVWFSADPSSGVTNGFQVGDVVDVTYTANAVGAFTATNVQFVEESASGQVTAVTAASLTISDDGTGQSQTFIADPDQGMQIDTDAFTGIPVGDEVSICFHESAGQLIADDVTDEGPAQEQNGSSPGGQSP